MKKIFFTLWCLLTIFTAAAQSTKSFTNDKQKVIAELKAFLTESDKKSADDLMDKFTPYWSGGKFSDSQQDAIIKTWNTMLKKRMKPFTDFSNYLYTLMAFADAGKPAEMFTQWQNTIDKILVMPSKNFLRYIPMSNFLFKENSLYSSQAAKWQSDDDGYTFTFDSVPKIVFGKMSLTCFSKNDSNTIYNTKGIYEPLKEIFHGEGGRVNWVKAGWKENEVYAELGNYTIDVTGSDWTADSVTFINTNYFSGKPLIGKFSDKILAAQTEENASYPRFESYTTELEIKNLVKDVDYVGGFSMKGNRFIGSGNKEGDAKLYFKREGKQFLVAASQGFVVRPERIMSDNASVTFYWEGDSLYHPSVSFKYVIAERELALFSGEDGKSKAPYFDSYHQLDLYFDALYWKIDQPLMNMKMISGEGESQANFESSNYFKKQRFELLQGLSETHPMYLIKKYCESHDTRIMYAEDLAKEMRLSMGEIRSLLISYANYGFLTYDSKDDKVLVKDRLIYYVLANAGKSDYDVIQFKSIIKGLPNASINLLNFELTMRGLAPIALSDSQNVVIYPTEQEVKMKKNREFTFSGRVKAGRFDFFGKEFAFDYQNFKINLNNVDSLRLKVESNDEEFDEYGKRKLVTVRSVLEAVTGDLLIDNQFNKSGRLAYPEYPIFNSKKNSYVYYDKPSIQNGVYKKEDFHFYLDPFTIDSLDNFTKAGLKFEGNMITAGIFEDFRDTLKLQKDYSLGLVRNTGNEGWQAYGGKGKFTNTISVSNDGLRGDGVIDYVSSTSKSKDFIFFPDSMNSTVESFVNRKETVGGFEFPEAHSENVYEHWMPKKDVMEIYKGDSSIAMFEGQSKMDGNLQLRPDGMTGDGVMHFINAELESDLIKYKSNNFGADTSDFRLLSDVSNSLAFSTNNVNSKIDFTKRLGEFKSNGGGSVVNFPVNQYICFIDQFKWFMDQQELELSSSETAQAKTNDTGTGIDLQGSEFISVEPRQDSLRFKAPFAKYNLRDYMIKAEKVAAIQSADATVIPDSGKVVIEKYAKMQTLNNSRIVANNTTKYHNIFNATVNILGRKKYEGSGDYHYVDENNQKHLIHFNNISVDTSLQTVAVGELNDTSGFPLSEKFLFKGNAYLEANKEFLKYSGFARPDFACEKLEKSWIKFSGDINPASIFIPIENPVSDAGTKLSASIAQTSDSTGIYAAFLMPKRNGSDREIITANGVLTYDKTSQEFRIAPKEKFQKANTPGNYLAVNDKTCLVNAEGKLEFGSDLGQVKLQTVGTVTNNLNNDSTNFSLMMAIDFYFNEDALKVFGDYLSTNPSLTATNDIGSKSYEKGLAELVGREKADKLITELNLYGNFKKFPEELRHTLFLTDVKMVYDKDSRSFVSRGPIGIGSVDKISANKLVNGNIQIIRKRSGDIINIYFEPENSIWYFFSYTRGLMQAISSNSAFNDPITKIKPDKRVNKEKDKPDLEYMLSTDRKVKDFLKKLNPVPEEN